MTDTEEDLIRKRAYEIWEAEGFPEGREQMHWEQAARELAEENGGVDAAPAEERPAPMPLSIVQGDAMAAPVKKRGKAAS